MRFPFVGDAYAARSENANSQQTVNLYLEANPANDYKNVLYGTPGSLTEVTLGAAAQVRQSMEYDGICYFVCGNKFYSMTTANTVTELGTLNTSAGYVSIVTNGLVILIVDGADGYTYTISGATFAVISDVDFPANPVAADVLDSIFIVIDGGTQAFYISTTGTSWDAGDFASAEAKPDNLTAVLVDHQELILGGEETTEVWYNSGDATFTFARRAVIETGTIGEGAICKADNSVFFLGNDGVVWRLNAYTPTRVSTHAIELAISKYDNSDCRMWSQKEGGHVFVWCQFPTGGETWVFDVATNAWHRRAYRNTATGVLERHRANCYVYFNRKHLIGDYEDGRVMKLSQDIYDDDGDPLPSIRVCRSISGADSDRTVRHNSLTIKVESGVGLSTGQGSAPVISLKWSDDSGHTYGNTVTQSLGAIGEYYAIAKWDRLGSVRAPNDRVYWTEIVDPVKRVIVGALLDVS